MAEYSNDLPEEPKVSYLTADHLGSPRIITDGIGAVVSRHDYLAFGDEVTETVGNVGGRTSAQGYGETDEIRKQYTGYERDKESGLDFAQARYYNSDHGRFTSVDPLTASANVKNPQTFNRYSYVLNSPYKFTDPLGLISEHTGACGTRCANSDGGSGGGFGIGLYNNAGQLIPGTDLGKPRAQIPERLPSIPEFLEGLPNIKQDKIVLPRSISGDQGGNPIIENPRPPVLPPVIVSTEVELNIFIRIEANLASGENEYTDRDGKEYFLFETQVWVTDELGNPLDDLVTVEFFERGRFNSYTPRPPVSVANTGKQNFPEIDKVEKNQLYLNTNPATRAVKVTFRGSFQFVNYDLAFEVNQVRVIQTSYFNQLDFTIRRTIDTVVFTP